MEEVDWFMLFTAYFFYLIQGVRWLRYSCYN
jgi:hypothetical protein